ncbi:MAG: hypothetical protein FIB00_10890 [Chloroflexi bacterium]|nr:hypothetical protein [Chloroflexota bacterium]
MRSPNGTASISNSSVRRCHGPAATRFYPQDFSAARASDGCGTIIRVDDVGFVNVYSGGMDIGQGLDTVLPQIEAETPGPPSSRSTWSSATRTSVRAI